MVLVLVLVLETWWLTTGAEYSGEFSYLNFSMKIRKKIDEWIKAAAPEVFILFIVDLCTAKILRLPLKLKHLKTTGVPLSCSPARRWSLLPLPVFLHDMWQSFSYRSFSNMLKLTTFTSKRTGCLISSIRATLTPPLSPLKTLVRSVPFSWF